MMQSTQTQSSDSNECWFWSFVAISESHAFHKRSKVIDDEVLRRGLPSCGGLILRAILLVEASQRPLLWRAIERVVDLTEATVGLPRRRSLGMFQMKQAPFHFRAQAVQAVEHLVALKDSQLASINDVARYWNGASQRQPGASLGYADALRIAMRVLSPHSSAP